MAEIRVNATGGLKLFDADDSHYAQIIAGTITSNVDVLTLGHASADFNIPVKVLGTTPTLTIGDAGAEDTKIVFDGNAQDFYIGLDDSADDLVIGVGSALGTTTCISITDGRAITVGEEGIASSIGGVTWYSQGTSIYTTDVSGTDSSANNNYGIGSTALDAITTGDDNIGLGFNALGALTTGIRNTAIGSNASGAYDAENDNIAIGIDVLSGSVNGGEFNICIGNYVGDGLTSGDSNTAIGHNCMTAAVVGDYNVTVGRDSLASITDADSNVAVGYKAALSISTGDNNICIGREAGVTGSPGGNLTTGSNEIVLGDENITESHIQVDWTVASDKRDKTDVTNLDLGLDFINKLTPVTYKWDKRSKYIDKDDPSVDLNEVTTDGTHKEDWLDVGFLAQDVAAIEETYNYKISDKTNLTTKLSKDGKQYSTSYTKFVPMLVKSIQELTARVKELEAK